MIEKAGAGDGVGLFKIVGKKNAVEERTPAISLQFLCRIENVLQSLLAASRDDEHAKPALANVLKLIVQSDFSFPTVGVALRTHGFRRVIEFNDEIEGATSGCHQSKCAVRPDRLVANPEPATVLSTEVGHSNSVTLGADDRVDDEIGQAPRVVLVRDADFIQVTFRRRPCALTVENAETGKRELEIGRRSAGRRGRIQRLLDPASSSQFMHAFPDAPQTPERLLKRRAELQ